MKLIWEEQDIEVGLRVKSNMNVYMVISHGFDFNLLNMTYNSLVYPTPTSAETMAIAFTELECAIYQ